MADLSAAPSPPRAPALHSPEGDTAAPARAPPQRWGTEPSGGMRARARTGPARGGNALGRLCAAPRPSPPLPGPRAAPGDGGRASAGGGRRAAVSEALRPLRGRGRSAGPERRGSVLSVTAPGGRYRPCRERLAAARELSLVPGRARPDVSGCGRTAGCLRPSCRGPEK